MSNSYNPSHKPIPVSETNLPEIFQKTANRLNSQYTIHFFISAGLEKEEFCIKTNSGEYEITASTEAGLFFGLQDLITELQSGKKEINKQSSPIVPQRVLKLSHPKQFCMTIVLPGYSFMNAAYSSQPSLISG